MSSSKLQRRIEFRLRGKSKAVRFSDIHVITPCQSCPETDKHAFHCCLYSNTDRSPSTLKSPLAPSSPASSRLRIKNIKNLNFQNAKSTSDISEGKKNDSFVKIQEFADDLDLNLNLILGGKLNTQRHHGYMIEEMTRGFNNYISEKEQKNDEEIESFQKLRTLNKRKSTNEPDKVSHLLKVQK